MLNSEIIAIGREILDGRVTDTNSVYLGDELNKIGLCPRHSQKVDDHIDRIVETFKIAQQRSDIILVTGGLGPTSDDLTIEAFAKFIGKSLSLNSEALKQIEQRFKSINRPFTETQKKQAYFPEGGSLLINLWGTAPGFSYVYQNTRWFFMPGVPKEMKGIFKESVLPQISDSHTQMQSYTWYTHFTSEGDLQKRLSTLIKKAEAQGFEFTFRTKFPENHIGLISLNQTDAAAREFELIQKSVSEELKNDCFSEGETPSNLEIEFLNFCQQKNIEIVTAESCTGGLIANRITKIPGASKNFWGSFVCYDNSAKIRLGVDPKVIQANGAVSDQCATELASNAAVQKVQSKTGATVSISTTGIAGPTGGTKEKPVGLCYVCVQVCSADGKILFTQTEKVIARTGLSREENILFFSQFALALGLKAIKSI